MSSRKGSCTRRDRKGSQSNLETQSKAETRITKGIRLKEISPQSGDPERNIPKKDFQLRVIAFRIIIIPRPTPKPHASASVVCLALLQASSLHPAKMGEAVKEGGESRPSSRAGSRLSTCNSVS